jgi:glycosyltransferase involved in cell wall biosynthesis
MPGSSAAARVAGLCRSLARAGHEVAIFAPRGASDSLGCDVEIHELRLERFEQRTAEAIASDPSMGRTALREARSLFATVVRHRALGPIREFGAQLLYERDPHLSGAGSVIARQLHVPLVLEVEPMPTDEGGRRPSREEESSLRSADRLVAASEAVVPWLLLHGVDASRIVVLPDAIDLEAFEAAERGRDELRRRLGVQDKHVIGYAGPLDPGADLETVILAVALLHPDGIEPHLLLVGAGENQDRLEKLVRRIDFRTTVTFVTDVGDAERLDYLAAFDIAVATEAHVKDLSTAAPRTVLEYLATGRPVVAAEVAEFEHCVRSGKTGWAYPPGDAGTLACAFGILLRNPEWATELQAGGRAHVREEHSWDENVRILLEHAAGVPLVA